MKALLLTTLLLTGCAGCRSHFRDRPAADTWTNLKNVVRQDLIKKEAVDAKFIRIFAYDIRDDVWFLVAEREFGFVGYKIDPKTGNIIEIIPTD